MRIRDDFMKCVTYIGMKEEDEEIRYRGTGFFVCVDHVEEGWPFTYQYLVTARHVANTVKDFR